MAKKIERRILGYKDFKKTKDGLEKPKKHPIKEGHILESKSDDIWKYVEETMKELEAAAKDKDLKGIYNVTGILNGQLYNYYEALEKESKLN